MQQLQQKYIKEAAPQKLSGDEQSESVDRLFYQQVEWQAEKQKQLERKWIPRKPPVKIEQEVVYDLVDRLGQVPERREPELTPSPRQSRDTTEDCVQRLHYFAQEYKKKRFEELENKYIWGPKSKQVGPEGVHSMLERLVPPPNGMQSAKSKTTNRR